MTTKRWNATKEERAENPAIDAFLVEVVEVSRRHGMSIAHEDCGGGFLIQRFKESNIAWLSDAADETEEK